MTSRHRFFCQAWIWLMTSQSNDNRESQACWLQIARRGLVTWRGFEVTRRIRKWAWTVGEVHPLTWSEWCLHSVFHVVQFSPQDGNAFLDVTGSLFTENELEYSCSFSCMDGTTGLLIIALTKKQVKWKTFLSLFQLRKRSLNFWTNPIKQSRLSLTLQKSSGKG